MFEPSLSHPEVFPATALPALVPQDAEIRAHLAWMRELRPGLRLYSDDTYEQHDLTAQGEIAQGLRIVVLLEGTLDVSYGARRLQFAAQGTCANALLVSVAEPDVFTRRSRRGGYARRVSLTIDQSWLAQAAGGAESSALDIFMRHHLAVHQWQASQRVTAIAEQIVRPPEFEPLMQNLYLESRVLELISEALAAVPGTTPRVRSEAPRLHPQDHRRMRELHDYLARYEDDDLSLKGIAKHACTNPNTLQKQFRALYGMTVFEFVRESRLQRARQALERDGVSVGQAAITAGYSSAANFATAYKRRFGAAPKLSRSRI
ncbi:transcriptional regulator [Polaromonas sp.]|nr:transcriptional regulator [Polaromonas sp.]